MNEWKIFDKTAIDVKSDSEWIEEEERLINWSENPIFEKQSLNYISITFIYVDVDKNIVGVAKTNIDIEKHDAYSLLYKSDFVEKIEVAKNPIKMRSDTKDTWLEKTYCFEDAVIYNGVDGSEHRFTMNPILFSIDNTAKISNSLTIVHDLYELIVIMREVKDITRLKSILKDHSTKGKTKKVRISDDSPKEYLHVRQGRRKTHKR